MKLKISTIAMLFAVIVVFVVIYFVESGSSNIECAEFQDNYLWSSNYSLTEDSVSYHTWKIKNKCPSDDCFMQKIESYARMIDYTDDGTGYGYAQIASLSESNCENPSEASYSRYAAYQTIENNEDMVFVWDCGQVQSKNMCSMKKADGYSDTDCFSVKVFAKQFVLMDVIKVNYTWCWNEDEKTKEET